MNYRSTNRVINSPLFQVFLNGNIVVSFTMPTFISRFNVGLVHLNLKLGCLCSTQLLICFSICIKCQNDFAKSLNKYIKNGPAKHVDRPNEFSLFGFNLKIYKNEPLYKVF